MPLEIQIQKSITSQDAGAVTVKLTGSLDTATAPELERQLAPVLAGLVKDIVFDLAQLKFISSAGLRVLLGAAKPVHILTPSATVRRIVNMTALTVADANAER